MTDQDKHFELYKVALGGLCAYLGNFTDRDTGKNLERNGVNTSRQAMVYADSALEAFKKRWERE